MNNLFETQNIPENEPFELVVGDLWQWKRVDLADAYNPSLYTLSYTFNCETGGGGSHTFNITATSNADNYSVSVGSSTTANYNPTTTYGKHI